ncbi:integrin alpha, partial [Dolichospermum sp. ST_sed5]|nr:integrin alpha [Dolichospermum sp. ST_sed5]
GDVYVIYGNTYASGRVFDKLGEWGTYANLTLYGGRAGDAFGSALACSDVNNDGFDDVIIGAPGADGPSNARSSCGDVYVLYGSNYVQMYGREFDNFGENGSAANLTMYGGLAGDAAGSSVASGDVNNDSFDDVIIGAYQADGLSNAREKCGDVYVVYGNDYVSGRTFDNLGESGSAANLTMYGGRASDRAGFNLACGDVNNDYFDDLIVGAYWADGPGNARESCGDVYVVYGRNYVSGRTFDSLGEIGSAANLTIYGGTSNDDDGSALACSDINDDGYSDIIIGVGWADGPDNSLENCGETYVIYGNNYASSRVFDNLGESGSDANLTIYGGTMAGGDHAGYTVTYGDINGDGYNDTIIAAPGVNDPYWGTSNCGAVYVVYGASSPLTPVDLLTDYDLVIYGGGNSDYAGSSLASGDINNDGFDDVIIGAPDADGPSNARSGCGDVYVIYGNNYATGRVFRIGNYVSGTNLTMYGGLAGDAAGSALACGDVNNDGYADVIIGANGADGPSNGRSLCGDVYVFYGNNYVSGRVFNNLGESSSTANLTLYGGCVNDSAGSAVSCGDVNNDGYSDVIIGAKSADGPSNARSSCGDVYVLYGNTYASGRVFDNLGESGSAANLTMYGGLAVDAAGSALASGDVNSDGFDEVIIGAYQADGSSNARSSCGDVYVIYGNTYASGRVFDNLG